MEQSSFELTPEQKGMLAAFFGTTETPLPALVAAITAALEEVRAREPAGSAPDALPEHAPAATASHDASLPIWERIRETFSNLSEEDLAALPLDGAAQVDHYAYGVPKR
jgi:hypothetical protein